MMATQAIRTNFREIRDRLRNPPNAVRDDGIDLKRKAAPPVLALVENTDALAEAISPPATLEERITQAREQIYFAVNHYNSLVSVSALSSTLAVSEIPEANIKVTMSAIMRVVCEHYRISKQDLCAARRTQNLIEPRHVAIYLARELTGLSYPEIGRKMARDHTSCLHAVDRIRAKLECDPDFGITLGTLTEAIKSRSQRREIRITPTPEPTPA